MAQEEKIKTISIPVLGMTCAGCAVSVESIISAQQGVKEASVNYATQKVSVSYDPEVIQPESMQTAVQSGGYDLIVEAENADELQQQVKNEQYQSLKKKTIISGILALPVVIIGMFYMDMPYGNYIMMLLTAPIVFYFGRNFFINALTILDVLSLVREMHFRIF